MFWEETAQVSIVVAGLGVMGGSVAMALQKAAPVQVVGLDQDPAVVMQALKRRAIDEVCNDELLAQADMLVLALPPRAAVSVLTELAPKMKKGAIVTDLCGVKRFIVQECTSVCEEHGLYFVGAHPMAGKEKSGFSQADATLFHGASFIITPADNTPDRVLDAMYAVAKALGCTRMTVTTPEEHDRMIAFTSQLPHVLAGAYVQSPCSARHEGFSAGSYRDVSRVAPVDETLWSELFALNSDLLENELEQLIARLEEFRKAIEEQDEAHMMRMIKEGRLCKLRADGKSIVHDIEES